MEIVVGRVNSLNSRESYIPKFEKKTYVSRVSKKKTSRKFSEIAGKMIL